MPIAPQITNTPVDITSADFAITAVSYTSSTATYTAAGHTFSAGDTVIISGIVPAGYSGTFTVSSVVAGTSFTCANTTNLAVTTATGDAFSANATDFTYADVQQVRIADNVDVNAAATAAAQAEADAQTAITNAATAISTANAANATATSAAYTAGVAQTTANGKNTSHYSTSSPSGTGVNGDLWFQVNGGGTVLYQYAYNGSSWIAAPISNTVIANLDAGKITAGTITGIAYNNGSGTFSVSPSGVLVASSATITGNITATSGTFTGTVYASAGTFTGTVTATSGSFTGSIYASSGTVGGFTIGSTYLSGSGSFFVDSSTGNATFNSINIGYSGIPSWTSSGALTVTTLNTNGNAVISGQLEVTGNLQIDTVAVVASPSSANYNTLLISKTSSGATLSRVYGYNNLSSAIYKENITDFAVKNYLDIINKMRPVTFNYKADQVIDPESVIMGMIAEDIDAIEGAQDLVEYDEGKPSAIRYDKIPLFIIKAVQELSAKVSALEGK
jgi:trimeric autotransporter adhesin